MSRILIVEDENALRADLVDYMCLNGFEAQGAGTAADMYAVLAEPVLPDVIILDISLPDGNGFELATDIRARLNCGIIMLTAHGDPESRVQGFESGADIYLVKHTSLREISAAVQSLLRRLAPETEDPSPQQWQLDPTAWKLLAPDGKVIRLTATENTFVSTLIEHSGATCTRDQLSSILSRRQTQFDNRHLDAVVSRLRRKITDSTSAEQPIKSVYGVGYSFGAPGRIDSRQPS
ncbi:response regulator transcription factor [Roseibium sp. Sym1]|uniref:response regulator transcription factor n=1 Tax=Roseibium sp. Sym1 TaxID=3016006 RepID=UPI0022B36B64|nr:response regulator transcription factor [Roseibium sp. Sym1]